MNVTVLTRHLTEEECYALQEAITTRLKWIELEKEIVNDNSIAENMALKITQLRSEGYNLRIPQPAIMFSKPNQEPMMANIISRDETVKGSSQ